MKPIYLSPFVHEMGFYFCIFKILSFLFLCTALCLEVSVLILS